MTDILALDPGEHTGFALLRGHVLVRTGVLPIWQTDHPDYTGLCNLIELLGDGVVVAERFAGRNLTAAGQHTLKILGVIEFLTLVYRPHLHLVWQRPDSRMPFLADYALPLLIPHVLTYKREQHPFDAFAHALCYLATTCHIPPETVGISPKLCVVGLHSKKVTAQ